LKRFFKEIKIMTTKNIRRHTRMIKIIFYINFSLLFISQICYSQGSFWTKQSNIPTSRWHLSSEVIGDNIYAIGGVGGYTALEEYNTESNSWIQKQQMSTARAFLGCGTVNGKIYIIGGAVLGQTPNSAVEEFNPLLDTLIVKKSMPSSRQGMGSCVVDDKIYIIGGITGNGSPNDKVDAYDPITDEWTTGLIQMPTARWEPECVVIEEKIYTIGGFTNTNSGTTTNAVEMYDPATNQWKNKASLPDKRGGGEAVALNGVIYYFGGSRDFGDPLDNVWAYISSDDKWIELADMPFGWFLMTGSVVDDKIYLMGGSRIAWPHNDDFKEVYLFTPPDSLLVGVNEEIQPDYVPSEFKLRQNYPNPFNPTTTINYTIPHKELVSLKIFNVLGREVQTLVRKEQSAGNYETRWNALDNNNNNVASGVYFYQLRAEGVAQVKKMLLLK